MNVNDFVSSLTDEQWQRVIAAHRKRLGKEVTQVLPPTESFGDAMTRLLTQAGESQAELDRVRAGILALAEGRGE